MRKMIVLCAGFLLVFGAGLVAAEDETIVAEGSGEGANPEEALMAAKRNAIEKGIGTGRGVRAERDNRHRWLRDQRVIGVDAVHQGGNRQLGCNR